MKRFETWTYEVTLGQKPKGYGLWWFSTKTKQYQITGYYTDAKKELIKQMKAAEDTSEVIKVMP